jgi:hypothetical protein
MFLTSVPVAAAVSLIATRTVAVNSAEAFCTLKNVPCHVAISFLGWSSLSPTHWVMYLCGKDNIFTFSTPKCLTDDLFTSTDG